MSKMNSRFDGTLQQDLLLSSDEEEEARNPMESRFNEYGKDIKRLAHKRQRSEENVDFEREEKLARMKEKIYRDDKIKSALGGMGLAGRSGSSSGYGLSKLLTSDNDLGPDGFVQSSSRIRIV